MSTKCLAVLLFLVVQSILSKVCCSTMCNNPCCRFVETFPGRLRRLRQDYVQIRDFYEANDDLDTALLDQTVEDSFRTPFACHAMNSILEFYLGMVLPAALSEMSEETRELKPYVESIQLIFDELKRNVAKCRKYFACQKQFDIMKLNTTYNQLENKGVYKAMGELDVLFNYIEIYLASKRHRNHAVSL
ncbi:interleukin-10 [Syngnathoides biaculeatus]|uniref:interleukin-10 n=1 Tax=Syngnathoides biaculeatus TaxID=300417 RepID=UPI002ADE3E7F|nr:interleukin-10 [Syngnathoides biaculeatus]